MHPALSIILFSTLSGSGYGLLFWLGLRAVVAPQANAGTAALIAYGLALLLVSVGLTMSLGHLGQPTRAWRAFSQWRTSWLSREGVVAVATYVPALVLCAAAGRVFAIEPVGLRIAGVLLCAGALGTVACTAMIYASLEPIAAWRDRRVLPIYLAYALLGGAWWFVVTDAGSGQPLFAQSVVAALVILLLGIVLLAMKLAYWRATDAAPCASDAQRATGLTGIGTVRSFEAPHTEANYLLREMGFVVARRHGTRLRRIALAAGFALPPIALACALLWPPITLAALLLAALTFQCGAFVERWLFFAQARHTVTLYYRAGES